MPKRQPPPSPARRDLEGKRRYPMKSFRLSAADHARLQHIADAEGLNDSQVIREALIAYMDAWEGA